ncbi:hypothetical protein Tco_1223774 [Tanacetum coccineum]
MRIRSQSRNPDRQQQQVHLTVVEPFDLKEPINNQDPEPPIVTMADHRTMVELLRAPTEGYVEAIVVPPILAEHFVLKHYQFINVDTRTNSSELRKTILMTTFYKDLLRACPHHGFTELHQLDTFYNALTLADQDSLNSAAGGNLLEKGRNSKLTHAVNQQTSDVTTAMTAILKQFQATPPPALSLNSNTVANPNGESKAITTQSGLVLDGPTILMPPPFVNPEEGERV